MTSSALDEIDEGILYALQRDARGSTTTALGNRFGVSASTVSNRIDQLESDGIITGYQATVDYERAGFPLNVLMVCSAPVGERSELAHRVLDIPGVVNVRELMIGENNIRIETVGVSNDDLTRIATALPELGLVLKDEILIRDQYFQPLKQFRIDEDRTGEE
ncbi:Lrp/AsnC family transcriptional regulator (plasmid) [Haladaptatus sp. SPP-AMP-3]|uniref:Lrp/AsnC family transcriptional regulator n=1 Tax=Haladaptatus sp. SPP-AMP-3 TaxID=3121295 RepID=UPI003C30CCB1